MIEAEAKVFYASCPPARIQEACHYKTDNAD